MRLALEIETVRERAKADTTALPSNFMSYKCTFIDSNIMRIVFGQKDYINVTAQADVCYTLEKRIMPVKIILNSKRSIFIAEYSI
jgi:hypothetical protein